MPSPTAPIYDYGSPPTLELIGSSPHVESSAPAADIRATTAPRYEGLAPVRMAAAFFVILNHTTYLGIKDAPESVASFLAVVNDIAWRVPFFLLLAGFLFARSTQGKGTAKVQDQCAKSAWRIWILLGGWSVLYLLNPPFKALFQWDVPGIMQHYSHMAQTLWPSILWVGPCYHLWFLVSMVMVWLLFAAVNKAWPGVGSLVNNRTAKPLLASLSLLVFWEAVALKMPPTPVSGLGQLLEVIVVHVMLPFSFMVVGAALWHHRTWLTKPAVLVTMVALGTVMVVAETTLGLGLDGPGPRSLNASGLFLAVAALGVGLWLPVKSLSPVWSLSPGIYCAHMLVLNRLDPVFAKVQHWSSSLLLACAAFGVSLGVCLMLSRFQWSRRFVQ